MKTYLPVLIVPAVFVGVGFYLIAQEGAGARTTGRVLLLKTGHAMEGDIARVGTQLCVRRGKSEVWIAEDKAIRLCADWNDAFAYALTQIKADDANDRVRLARWCHTNRLTGKALEQARIALELQPTNTDAKQIATLLERALRETATPRPAAPVVSVAVRSEEPAPTVDVSFETLLAFTTKAQPILMNTCVACHANGGGGKFHLERISESGQKVSTQRNLAAVLAYIDLERPTISTLLVKAITPHGGAQAAPLKDRSAKPMQSLQDWVLQTIAHNPQLKEYAAKKHTPGKAIPEPKGVFPTMRSAAPAPIDEPDRVRVQPAAAPRTPMDEFDAVIFNTWAHPHHLQQSASSRP